MSLLATAPVGRVGLSVGALPTVLPVNFVVIDGDVVFATVEGSKFHAATNGAVLAFEADDWEPSGRSGWNVVVQGLASVIDDPVERRRVSAVATDSWAMDGAADRFVRIHVASVSGRRFRR
jgi:uncharacterized protein